MKKFIRFPLHPVILLSFLFVMSSCAAKKPLLDEVFNLATATYDKGQYERAAKHYEEFLESDQESPLREVALYHLADCYKNMGEADKAIATYAALINQYREGFWVERAKEDSMELKQALMDIRARSTP